MWRFALSIVLLTVVFISFGSVTFAENNVTNTAQASAQHHNKDDSLNSCLEVDVALCAWRLLSVAHHEILSAFTILLAIGTFLLALYTKRLVAKTQSLAADAQKQFLSVNRPKVILRDATSSGEMHAPIRVKYTLANIGTSRAIVFAAAVNVEIVTTPGFDAKELPESAGIKIEEFAIEPGEQITRTFESDERWTEHNGSTNYFESPDLGLFFSGRVIYRDTLNIVRRTGFRRRNYRDRHRFLVESNDPHYEYQD